MLQTFPRSKSDETHMNPFKKLSDTMTGATQKSGIETRKRGETDADRRNRENRLREEREAAERKMREEAKEKAWQAERKRRGYAPN